MKVRTKARRDAIVEEAALLFQEMGYERASMNELVKRIGGSKATLYRYFPSKEALFVAVVREHATQHLTEAAEGLMIDAQTFTLEQTLMRFAERKLQVVANDNSAIAVYRMVVAESGNSDIGTLFYDAGIRESVTKLSELMAIAMERKELHLADPHLRALQFLSLLTAEVDMRVYQRQLTPLSTPQIREMVCHAVHMFLNGAAFRDNG
ncbi:TPA: TetR/AcrR family transcriptional regulator [Serratia marcescens]|uniref:TetR/AcrR family transcriptional regulator n=1 Tax=Serratia TaxID=613 RepID=UPI001572D8B8|nr:TetR/AcrR family transcriptional regulator [Serratia marcescens]NSM15691.1 TetR family transcriptional regulator [Serratia marcescens]NSM97701.1 TetR family transcriptional regulator [Serratia marcescens]CAF2583815.1 A-factor receptor protein [Serratia marcescens]CAF2671561.1 A-factor receptor protein [Serratia marcescens]CAH5263530.1 A-factor receptor protein [Serratia marcescens]